MPRRREILGKTRTPGGLELTLSFAGGYFILTLDGTPLMTSAAHYSEEHMAEVGCEGLADKKDARVLVGGLGMGYTLRASLDRVPETGRVVVAELLPAVVEWNEGPLADLASRPLDDPRTELALGDIVAYLQGGPEPFDAILLDTDNGPDDFTERSNRRMYDPAGLSMLRRLLKPGGRLVVWSAYQCAEFVDKLKRAGYVPRVVRIRARGHKGGRHALYVGERRS